MLFVDSILFIGSAANGVLHPNERAWMAIILSTERRPRRREVALQLDEYTSQGMAHHTLEVPERTIAVEADRRNLPPVHHAVLPLISNTAIKVLLHDGNYVLHSLSLGISFVLPVTLYQVLGQCDRIGSRGSGGRNT